MFDNLKSNGSIVLSGVFFVLLALLWPSSLATAQDTNSNGIADRLELPGTQPGVDPGAEYNINVTVEPASLCASIGCHAVDPTHLPGELWKGSMMANAARDPVFWAQLDVAEADEAIVSSLAGARDLCLRCHAPKGWLEARSHDPNADATTPPDPNFLQGMMLAEHDLFGVQCEICHRLVDPHPNVPIASVNAVDRIMLDGGDRTGGLLSPSNPAPGIPESYGIGMYVVDRKDVRRGPYDSDEIGFGWTFVNTEADWNVIPGVADHPVRDSEFHRAGEICGTCHDVSNPGWPPRHGDPLSPNIADAQSHFPIERTFSEWKHSAFYARGEAGSCQSCHMSGPLNGQLWGPASGSAEADPPGSLLHVNDLHLHDFTGGNVVIPRVINRMIQNAFATRNDTPSEPYPTTACAALAPAAQRDCFLETYYADVVRTIYPIGVYARATGIPDSTPLLYTSSSLVAASQRAEATLRRAAELSKDPSSTSSMLQVRVWNKTGHKLPTGYPEGRRMWLEVEFEDINAGSGAASPVAWSGEYANAGNDTGFLFHDFDLNGSATAGLFNDKVMYTDGSGTGTLAPVAEGRRTQVWEARAHYEGVGGDPLNGTEFHFVLNNERLRDNRIPPEGWNATAYANALADQIRVYDSGAQAQLAYTDTCGEPTCNFDRVPYPRPGASDSAKLTLYYQSVSREYVKALHTDAARNVLYQHTGDSTGYSRADLLEHAWRTFSLDGLGERFPPVAMAELRVAILDSDDDGLPNDWETAHGLNPNGTTEDEKNQDRYGDIDNDGRSNYREFQNDTDPTTPASPARPPLDLALVLDYSGSMSGIAPRGGEPKIDVLKDAVDLFLTTWEQYATVNDRLAIVYFASAVDVEDGDIVNFATLAGQTVGAKIAEMVDNMRTRTNGGSTGMGGGLQRALNLVTTGGSGHRKHVILFTNGMQNISPMVREVGGDYVVRADDPAVFDDVYGDSGVTDAGGPAFGTPLSSLGVAIHTIGIGVTETDDDRWVNLLQGIAASTNDLDGNAGLYQFVSRGEELEGAFLADLVETLRNFSPQMLASYSERLVAGQSALELEFPVEAGAERATFVLSWSGAPVPGRLDFTLTTPDGTPAETLGRVTNGPDYTIFTIYFPAARRDGRTVDHTGVWKMTIGRQPIPVVDDVRRGPAIWRERVDFRAYAIAEIPQSDHAVRFDKRRYVAGEDVVLQAAIREAGGGFRAGVTAVTAKISTPVTGFGTFLSRNDVSQGALNATADVFGDQLPDMAARKSFALLSSESTASRIAPARSDVTLYDDGDPAHGDTVAGDGRFSARLGAVSTPGLVTADVTLTGQSLTGGPVSRRHRASAFVTHAPFDRRALSPQAEVLEELADGATRVRVVVTPRDTLGNFLGPGHDDDVQINVDGVVPGPAIDLLDGRYAREFTVDETELDADVAVTLDGEVLDSVPLDSITGLPIMVPLWVVILLLLIILILFALVIWLRPQANP